MLLLPLLLLKPRSLIILNPPLPLPSLLLQPLHFLLQPQPSLLQQPRRPLLQLLHLHLLQLLLLPLLFRKVQSIWALNVLRKWGETEPGKSLS